MTPKEYNLAMARIHRKRLERDAANGDENAQAAIAIADGDIRTYWRIRLEAAARAGSEVYVDGMSLRDNGVDAILNEFFG